MNLTIEQVSKITKLSIPTLYTYASRQKLGKKVGNKRVFSQADVQKLLKNSKQSPLRSTAKHSAKKATKRTNNADPIKANVLKPKSAKASLVSSKPAKPSLWSRLFKRRTA